MQKQKRNLKENTLSKVNNFFDFLGKAVIFILIINLMIQVFIISFLSLKPFYANAQTDNATKIDKPVDIDTKLSVPVGDFTGANLDPNKPETWIGLYIVAWFNYVVGAIGIVAMVMVMWGGILWLTSGGNTSQISQAKGKIKNAIVGIVLLLLSYTIFKTINPKLLHLTLPGIPKVMDTRICCQKKNNPNMLQVRDEKCLDDEQITIYNPDACSSQNANRVCTSSDDPPKSISTSKNVTNLNNININIDEKNACGIINAERHCIYIGLENGICILDEKNGRLTLNNGILTSGKIILEGEKRPRIIKSNLKCGEGSPAPPFQALSIITSYGVIGSYCDANKHCWAKSLGIHSDPLMITKPQCD